MRALDDDYDRGASFFDEIAVVVNASRDWRYQHARDDVLECGGRDDAKFCRQFGRGSSEARKRCEDDEGEGDWHGGRCEWDCAAGFYAGVHQERGWDCSGQINKACLPARAAWTADDDFYAPYASRVTSAAMCARVNVSDNDVSAIVLTNATGHALVAAREAAGAGAARGAAEPRPQRAAPRRPADDGNYRCAREPAARARDRVRHARAARRAAARVRRPRPRSARRAARGARRRT